MRKITLLLFLLLFTNIATFAQISEKGKPFILQKKSLSVPVMFEMKPFDVEKLLREDAESTAKIKPFRYGKVFDIQIDIKNLNYTDVAGGKLWRAQINSKNAHSLSLSFSEFFIPKGARLFVYTPNGEHILGAFTSKNNKTSGMLALAALPYDELIIEYFEPETALFSGKLIVGKLIHDYKGVFGYFNKNANSKKSGSCNVNINCSAGTAWQDDKHAVTKITFTSGSSGYLCTGTLMNNTRRNGEPYLLTANHCISRSSEANSAVFYFNYESPNCNGTNGDATQTVSGSILVATPNNLTLDFTLLKLSVYPPEEYSPYYAGWDRSDNTPSNTVAIHHPGGDIKKISRDDNPPVTATYSDSEGSFIANAHWKILAWEVGTTEGGSSGGGLFNENHHLVGDLTGGEASCGNSVNDFYQKFSYSWAHFSENTKQLKYWLDPINSGVETLDGYYPSSGIPDYDASIKEILTPDGGSYCINETVVPQVVIENKGTSTLTSAKILYRVDLDADAEYLWTGFLPTGESETVILPAISLPNGFHAFFAKTSLPNGNDDQYLANDSKDTEFTVYSTTPTPIISGDTEVCLQTTANFSTTANANSYTWAVTGGSIISSSTTSNIQVAWAEAESYSVDLQVVDACGSATAETFELDKSEQIKLELRTDAYPDEISWRIEDDSENVLYSADDFIADTDYSTEFCLTNGCYKLIISDSANDGICNENNAGFQLINQTRVDTLARGCFFSEKTIEFCINTQIFDNDAALYAILEPENTYCETETYTPKIQIRNKGKNTLSSVQIEYGVGAANKSFAWSGNLAYNAIETLELPQETLTAGSNSFIAKVSLPNSQVDDNQTNNMITQPLQVFDEDKKEMKFQIQTDGYGKETKWQLLNDAGELLYYGGAYANNTLYEQEFCLGYGCYSFKITDKSGDGICCGVSGDGSYTFSNLTDNELIIGGSDFGSEDLKDFCIYKTSINNPNRLPIKIYPNPAQNYVCIEFGDSQVRSIEIVDLLGQLLLQKSPEQGNSSSLNLGNLKAGTYLIRVKTNAGVYKQTLLKLN